MASSYISLRHIFDVAQFDLDTRSKIFRLLRLGHVGSTCAVARKINLQLCYTEGDLGTALRRLPVPESSHDFAFAQARDQSGVVRIFGRDGEYYTIREVAHSFQVFGFGGREDVTRNQEINPDFWEAAWIDENSWTVICDEIINMRRHEFTMVGLFRGDVETHLHSLSSPRKPRGRPKEYFAQPKACAAAKRILDETEGDISQTSWANHVLRNIEGSKPERTIFYKLYGHIYTEYQKIRKSEN